MSEKIDAVAEAIRNVVLVPGCGADNPGSWDQISDDAKVTWRLAARAAIKAIREPSREMLEASGDDWEFTHAGATYTLMIEAALSTPNEQ